MATQMLNRTAAALARSLGWDPQVEDQGDQVRIQGPSDQEVYLTVERYTDTWGDHYLSLWGDYYDPSSCAQETVEHNVTVGGEPRPGHLADQMIRALGLQPQR